MKQGNWLYIVALSLATIFGTQLQAKCAEDTSQLQQEYLQKVLEKIDKDVFADICINKLSEGRQVTKKQLDDLRDAILQKIDTIQAKNKQSSSIPSFVKKTALYGAITLVVAILAKYGLIKFFASQAGTLGKEVIIQATDGVLSGLAPEKGNAIAVAAVHILNTLGDQLFGSKQGFQGKINGLDSNFQTKMLKQF